MGSRLLIAVGAAASEPEGIPTSVRSLIEAAGEILVIAPALPGRLDWLTSATDKAPSKRTSVCRRCSGNWTRWAPEPLEPWVPTILCWPSTTRSGSSLPTIS